ncbi:MAG: dienelactone hydrolase family protein, partial [Deltaproteobacteria bacterium]|nr:dienelactone hydrolase family protein [Deltaproteobacteria bacterium]
ATGAEGTRRAADSTGAYLAIPASGSGPGVVVVQEWWGLVDHIRDVCDRLAREGFVALAPDLYRGEVAGDPDAAGRLMMDLEIPRATADLDAAVKALLDHDAVEGSRVGCIGFCMGGQLALSAAAHSPRIGAVVDCYGIHPKVSPDFAQMDAAVFGVFAEHDEFVPTEAVRQLESDLKVAGVRVRTRIHLGVQHAFMNDTRPDVYDAQTASEAWNEILAFLRAELL